MKDTPECQLIQLSNEQWKELRKTSDACIVAATRQTINRAKPLIVLIHALSTFQLEYDYEECLRILSRLDMDQFVSPVRMRVPFMICDENGPILHNGYVYSVERHSGRIILSDVPSQISGKQGIRFQIREAISLTWLAYRIV